VYFGRRLEIWGGWKPIQHRGGRSPGAATMVERVIATFGKLDSG
jgi:hypothetical protein